MGQALRSYERHDQSGRPTGHDSGYLDVYNSIRRLSGLAAREKLARLSARRLPTEENTMAVHELKVDMRGNTLQIEFPNPQTFTIDTMLLDLEEINNRLISKFPSVRDYLHWVWMAVLIPECLTVIVNSVLYYPPICVSPPWQVIPEQLKTEYLKREMGIPEIRGQLIKYFTPRWNLVQWAENLTKLPAAGYEAVLLSIAHQLDTEEAKRAVQRMAGDAPAAISAITYLICYWAWIGILGFLPPRESHFHVHVIVPGTQTLGSISDQILPSVPVRRKRGFKAAHRARCKGTKWARWAIQRPLRWYEQALRLWDNYLGWNGTEYSAPGKDMTLPRAARLAGIRGGQIRRMWPEIFELFTGEKLASESWAKFFGKTHGGLWYRRRLTGWTKGFSSGPKPIAIGSPDAKLRGDRRGRGTRVSSEKPHSDESKLDAIKKQVEAGADAELALKLLEGGVTLKEALRQAGIELPFEK